MMNNRWTELAEECWDEHLIDGWRFDQEKFARLIIDECVEIMKSNERLPVGVIQAKLAETHAATIYDYFGIK
jgi:hypothetical protein